MAKTQSHSIKKLTAETHLRNNIHLGYIQWLIPAAEQTDTHLFGNVNLIIWIFTMQNRKIRYKLSCPKKIKIIQTFKATLTTLQVLRALKYQHHQSFY